MRRGRRAEKRPLEIELARIDVDRRDDQRLFEVECLKHYVLIAFELLHELEDCRGLPMTSTRSMYVVSSPANMRREEIDLGWRRGQFLRVK